MLVLDQVNRNHGPFKLVGELQGRLHRQKQNDKRDRYKKEFKGVLHEILLDRLASQFWSIWVFLDVE